MQEACAAERKVQLVAGAVGLAVAAVRGSAGCRKAAEGHVSKVWFDNIVIAKEYIGPIQPKSTNDSNSLKETRQ